MFLLKNTVGTGAGLVYDAFISYSHSADGRLAPALQVALHRFAKPWWKLRAVNAFRDGTSLAAARLVFATHRAEAADPAAIDRLIGWVDRLLASIAESEAEHQSVMKEP